MELGQVGEPCHYNASGASQDGVEKVLNELDFFLFLSMTYCLTLFNLSSAITQGTVY